MIKTVMYMNVIKYIFIFLVTGVSAQTPTSLTVQKDLRVQGKTVLGGVSKIQDLTIYADTIRMSGLDGTGTFLTIDGSGDVIKGTVGAAGVTGLVPTEVLYGASDGTIEQKSSYIFDNTTDLNLITSDDLSSGFAHISTDYSQYATFNYHNIGITDGVHATNIYPNSIWTPNITWAANESYFNWDMPDILDFDDGPIEWHWHAEIGAAGSVLADPLGDGNWHPLLISDIYSETDPLSVPLTRTLTINGTSYDLSANRTWTVGTVTSIATTSPITGGPITGTGTIGINNAAADGSTKGAASFTANDFDASSGNIAIDYANGRAATSSQDGFLQSSDWPTFNKKTGLVQAPTELTAKTASINTSNVAYTTPASDGYYRVTITTSMLRAEIYQ